MTYDDIVALAKAGFNREQIAALAQVTTRSPAPSPSPAPATAAATGTVMPQAVAGDPLAAVLNKLNEMSIQQASQPQPETTDDILANIINPPSVTEV